MKNKGGFWSPGAEITINCYRTLKDLLTEGIWAINTIFFSNKLVGKNQDQHNIAVIVLLQFHFQQL